MGLPWRRAKAKTQMLAFISVFSVFFLFWCQLFSSDMEDDDKNDGETRLSVFFL
jgi:hypothetical protein